MSRILLVGNDGSVTNASQGSGACIARTARFQTALSNAGFSVDVCSMPAGHSSPGDVSEFLGKKDYSCVVAISPHPAEIAVRSGTDLPLWIDINGMHPAEIHLSGEKENEPRVEMLRMLALENSLLSRGDIFSAPSERQTHAIMGELYLLGRLDGASKSMVPVRAIPHCAVDAPLSTGPAGGFSIISTGSFNSWFDGATLFHGLEYAMSRNREISFTATGGSVPFAEEQYRTFLQRLSGSRFKDQFRIAGWVSKEELDQIQKTASTAVYTDIPCGETLLGARTRVLDWISRGIPVVCTKGAEISQVISDFGMGISVAGGDPEALGSAFLKLASEPDIVKEIKRSQESWRNGVGSMNSTFKPLIDWCSNPVILPRIQLCKATVPGVSSLDYRRMVLKEISSVAGKRKAAGFLFKSLSEKIRNRRN